MDLVVGFDLDMTLVDSRPCVVAVAEVLAAEEGVPIDGELWASRLGPPLEQELAHWVAPERVEPAADRYRELMREMGVSRSASVLLDDLTGFPTWLDGWVLEKRLALLDKGLRGLGSVLVAFSGGADSAFLLAAAVRSLGAEHVVAATAVSPSLATAELPAAQVFAAGLGVRHLTPGTDELSRPGYVANGADRCFHCKATLLDTLLPLAAREGIGKVATGTNADDAVAGFRPGIRAAAERGAVTPLLDAGLTKDQIRATSRAWGLETADKPALACLASRIAYGIEVTPQRLVRVDRAETALRALLQPTDVRVRDLGDGTARVELDAAALARWSEAAEAVVREGFDRVETREFRSGSMNDLLASPQQQA